MMMIMIVVIMYDEYADDVDDNAYDDDYSLVDDDNDCRGYV